MWLVALKVELKPDNPVAVLYPRHLPAVTGNNPGKSEIGSFASYFCGINGNGGHLCVCWYQTLGSYFDAIPLIYELNENAKLC